VKKLPVFLFFLLLFTASCSLPVNIKTPEINIKEDFSGLEKEYLPYSGKALTESYLLRKIEKWLADKNGPNLLKELLFAQFKYQPLLRDIMTTSMYNEIVAVPAVAGRMEISDSFRQFMESLNPVTATVSKLIFSRDGDGARNLFIRDIVSRTESQITNFSSGSAVLLNLSPDGSKLFFAKEGGNEYRLYTADLSQNPPVLTELYPESAFSFPSYHTPVWSPDGNKLVFSSVGLTEDVYNIYVAASDGSNRINITGNTEGNIDSSYLWSKDSEKLIYTRLSGSDRNIYMKNVSSETNLEIPITTFSGGAISQLNLSPAGSKLFFTKDENSVFRAYVADLSQVPPVITELNPDSIFSSPSSSGAPVWSPNGNKLVFTSTGTTEDVYNIYIADPDGSNLINLTGNTEPNVYFDHYVWSKDGDSLFYTRGSGSDKNLYMKNVSSGANPEIPVTDFSTGAMVLLNLSPDGKTLFFAKESSDYRLYVADLTKNPIVLTELFPDSNFSAPSNGAPVWSSDGNKIVFTSVADTDNVYNIYVADPDGGNRTNLTENTEPNIYFNDYLWLLH
jgi:Tol biopolymer transport system component